MSDFIGGAIAVQNNWKECKLGDIAKLSKKTWKVGDELMPYIGLEHIEESKLRLNSIGSSENVASNKFRFQADDTLFGKLRPYFRKVIKPNFDGVCSTDIWVLNPQKGIDKDFLFYFFANQELVDISYSASSGTRMPRADWDFLSQTVWNIPSIEEQKAIAEILSSLDDKIDLLHRQNQTLESLAQTLFRQWFIEEAKEEWEIGTFNDLVEVSSGKSLKRELFDDTGKYEVLGANGKIGKTNEWLFEEKLIYTGRVGTLGKVFLIDEVKKVWLSDNTLIIKPKRYFYFIYFLMIEFNFEEFNVGSTQPLIRQSDLKNIEILLPNDKLILKFEEQAKDIFIKINKNKKQIQTLENLRDTLLPKLLSGEVRMKI